MLVFTYSLVDSSDSALDSFDSPDFSSLKSSEIAPILPKVADKSAGNMHQRCSNPHKQQVVADP